MDHGSIIANDTPDNLKARVSGDVIHGRVAGDLTDAERVAKEALEVRSSSVDGGQLVLTVERGDTAVPVLLRALDAAHLRMTSVQVNRPTLDDAFLTLTGRSLREDAP
jgi:ABC-2 type transport system ATP-binding protein